MSQSGSLHCWDVTGSLWLPLRPTEEQSWTSSIFSGQEKLTHPTTYSKSKEKNETAKNILQLCRLERLYCNGQQAEWGPRTGRQAYLRAGWPRAAIEDLRVQALACGAGLWAAMPRTQAPGLWWWLSGGRSTREQLPVSGYRNGLGRSRLVKRALWAIFSRNIRPFHPLSLRTSVTDAVSSFSAFKLSPTARRKSESCDHEAGKVVPRFRCPPCPTASPSLLSTRPKSPRSGPCRPCHWRQTGPGDQVDGMAAGSQAPGLGLHAAVVLCQWDQGAEAAPGAAPGLGNTVKWGWGKETEAQIRESPGHTEGGDKGSYSRSPRNTPLTHF